MHCIQNSCLGKPTIVHEIAWGCISVATVTTVALSAIGLLGSASSSFGFIVRLGATTNGTLLGISCCINLLNNIWIIALFIKRRKPSNYDYEDRFPKPFEVDLQKIKSMESVPVQAFIHATEKINKTDQINNKLSEELVCNILNYFKPLELLVCREVCRKWRRIASDKMFWAPLYSREKQKDLQLLDKRDWKTYSPAYYFFRSGKHASTWQ